MWYLEEEVVALSLILSLSSFLEEGNWARISSDYKNKVVKKRCTSALNMELKKTHIHSLTNLWCWTGWHWAPVTDGPVRSDLPPAVKKRKRLEEDLRCGESAVYTLCCKTDKTCRVHNEQRLTNILPVMWLPSSWSWIIALVYSSMSHVATKYPNFSLSMWFWYSQECISS